MKLLKWTFIILLSFLFYQSSHAQTCNTNDSLALVRLGLRGGQYLNLSAVSPNPWGVGSVSGWNGIDTLIDPQNPNEYRIKSIQVPSLGAFGRLSDSLFIGDSLLYVESLVLSNNQISSIDNGLLCPDPNAQHAITFIDIENNAFVALPTTFCQSLMANLPNLREVRANNLLDITLPSTFSNYILPPSNTLEVFQLRSNDFEGVIDLSTILSTYPNLLSLYLNDNAFESITPASTPSNLEKLYVENNQLIDDSDLKNVLLNTPNLKWFYARNAMDTANTAADLDFGLPNPQNNLLLLDLGANNFTGKLPLDFFDKLPNIQQLYLDFNNFSGALPVPLTTSPPPLNAPVYSGTSALQELDLSNNQLDGSINFAWLLGSQLQQGVSGSNMPITEIYAQNNQFTEIRPELSDPDATTILGNLFSGRCANLKEVDVSNNALDFRSLFRLRRILRLKQVNFMGVAHYLPQAGAAVNDFVYTPQAERGIGGVRRRNPGERINIKAGRGLIEAEATSTNYISNRYAWVRIDTNGIAGGTPAAPVIQNIGLINQVSGSTTPNLVVNNAGGIAQTDPTYVVGIDLTPKNAHIIELNTLDPANHGEWLYRAIITNDSFPLLTLQSVPKKVEVGTCVDASGAPIHCQSMIVEFDPNTLAALSPTQQDSLKQALREELGAEQLDVCLCGDIELWGISDTASAMLEAFGKGTTQTTATVSAKPQLLSADPNYTLLGNNNSSLPDTVNLPAGSGNTTAKTLVAIIDSGVDYEYSALTPYISEGASNTVPCLSNATFGYNFLDDSPNATDDHGHGTSVAGIVAGISQQNIVPATSADNRDIGILPLKYTNKQGEGSLFHATCALHYAAEYQRPMSSGDTAKVRVINTSWGYYGSPCMVLENALDFVAHDCGILVVASAGNLGVQVHGTDSLRHWPSNSIWPGANSTNSDNILSVAGVDQTQESLDPLSNFSNIHIDVAAPWTDIAPTAGSTNGFAPVSGTSFATPQVARAAALLFDKYPDASYYAVKYALMNGVDILQSSDSLKIKSGGRINYTKADAIMGRIVDRALCSPNLTVNVQEIQGVDHSISIAPNPFDNTIFIELEQAVASDQSPIIELFNIQGQQVHYQELGNSQNQATIPTSDLAKGVYIIKITLNQQQYSKKIVKF